MAVSAVNSICAGLIEEERLGKDNTAAAVFKGWLLFNLFYHFPSMN
jgi:hypothetical protein